MDFKATSTFTLVSFLFSLGLQAQPSLSSSNLPSAGESYTVYTNTILSNNSLPGNSGMNVNWDFSSIGSGNSSGLDYSASSNNTYPNANIYFSTQGSQNYFDVANNALTYYGTSGSNFDIIYTDGQDQIRVPMDYGNTYSDTYEGSVSGFSQNFDRTGTVDVEADGYGTLQTPEGTYSDVLRIRIVRNSSDENNGAPVSANLDTIYFWYNEFTPHPIMTYTINYVEGSLSGSFANYIADSDVILSTEENELAQFQAYPNPVTDRLNFQTNEPASSIRVYSADGRVIREKRVFSISFHLDVSELADGIYYYALLKEDAEVVRKPFVKQ